MEQECLSFDGSVLFPDRLMGDDLELDTPLVRAELSFDLNVIKIHLISSDLARSTGSMNCVTAT